jgi:hypothetical protein
MKEFLARHSYLIIWISALIIVGSAATLIVQLNGVMTGSLYHPAPPMLAGQNPQAPTAPQPPAVTLTIVKSPTGNSLVVQWQNLPSNTKALNIFRGTTNATSTWSLWKTIDISAGDLANGNATINLGSSLLDGYSFYAEAVSDNGNASGTQGGGGNSNILWTSSSTVPIVTTSTPPATPPSAPPQNPTSTAENPQSPPTTPTSSPTSSNPVSGTNPTSPTSSAPTGNPYYNPEIQISGYGNAPGNFWVEHVNQSIEIGWQNLPENINAIVVARSASSTGPWSTIIRQQNPGTAGSYSLQIVDDTLNDPYYYEMTAFNGTTTIATYGPAYLAGN